MAGEFVDEKSWPFDDGDGQYVHEDEWGYMARRWQDDGVSGDPSQNSLKLTTSGLATNEVKIQFGQAVIGGYTYGLLIDKTLDVPVWGDATGPRWDRVVLHLNNTTNVIETIIRQGTKNTLPIVVAGDLELGTIATASTGVVTILADSRVFIGGRIQVVSSSTPFPEVPPDRSPFAFAYNVTTNRMYRAGYNTGTWVAHDPVTLLPAVQVFRSAGFSLTGTSQTVIPWDSEAYEVNTTADSMHSTSVNPSRLIAPVAGIYAVEFSVQLANSTSGVGFTVQTQIKKNGTNVRWGSQETPAVSGYQSQDIHKNAMQIQLAAGDYIEFSMSSTISGQGITAGSTTATGSMALITHV